MDPFYHAYEAYEKRVMRGELSNPGTPNKNIHHYKYYETVLARFGDFLVRTGTRLKCRYAVGKPMAWSPATRSRQ